MRVDYLDEIERWLEQFLWPETDGRQRVKRQRILHAATARFVRFGYRKTSVGEIARDSGVAKGTVYLYYRNKAELVLHAIALEKSAHMAELVPLLSEKIPAAERLQELIVRGLVALRQMPLLARLTEGDRELALALSEVDVSVLERINSWRSDFMVSLLDEVTLHAWPREALHERAQVLIDVIGAVAVSGQLAAQGERLEAYAATLAATLVHGIVAPTEPLSFAAPPSGQPGRRTPEHADP